MKKIRNANFFNEEILTNNPQINTSYLEPQAEVKPQDPVQNAQIESNQEADNPKTTTVNDATPNETPQSESANSPKLGFDIECRANDYIKTLKANGKGDAARKIEQILQSAAHNRFMIAIVGNTGSGKSSFINKIMGIDTLPANPWPTTTIATHICYGFENIATLTNSQGRKEFDFSISQQSWKEAYECQGHFDRAARDKRIYAKIPSNWLKKSKLELIDTPGLDIGSENIYSLCMGCDGIIFMTDANQALGKDEISFIEEWILEHKTPFFAIAVSKIDLVPNEQREALLARITSRIGKLETSYNKVIPLLLISSETSSYDSDSIICGYKKTREQLQTWSRNGLKGSLKDTWALYEIGKILSDVAQEIKSDLEDAEEETAQEKKNQIEKAQCNLDKAELQFCLLNADLIKRQKALLDELNGKVNTGIDNTVENLCQSVILSNDPAKWFTESYGHSKEKHFRMFAESTSRWLDRKMKEDIAWYAQSLLDPYSISLKACLKKGEEGKPDTLINLNETSSNDLQMKDRSQLDKGSQIASIIAMVGGSTLGPLIGIPASSSIIAGMLTRLAAGDWLNKKTQEQKDMICNEIKTNIPETFEEAVSDTRINIRNCYENIEEAAKILQEKWKKEQRAAIDKYKESTSEKSKKIALVDEQIAELIQDLPQHR